MPASVMILLLTMSQKKCLSFALLSGEENAYLKTALKLELESGGSKKAFWERKKKCGSFSEHFVSSKNSIDFLFVKFYLGNELKKNYFTYKKPPPFSTRVLITPQTCVLASHTHATRRGLL